MWKWYNMKEEYSTDACRCMQARFFWKAYKKVFSLFWKLCREQWCNASVKGGIYTVDAVVAWCPQTQMVLWLYAACQERAGTAGRHCRDSLITACVWAHWMLTAHHWKIKPVVLNRSFIILTFTFFGIQWMLLNWKGNVFILKVRAIEIKGHQT